MKLEINLSKAQVKEMAKMLYMARFVVDSSGTFSKKYQYPKKELFNSTLRGMYKAILLAYPKIGLVEVDERVKMKFTHTFQMEEEVELLINTFCNDDYIERLAYAISRKKFKELYGTVSNGNDEYFEVIYQYCLNWINENGIENLVIP